MSGDDAQGWSKARLMGVDPENAEAIQSTEPKVVEPALWGIPGYLTEEEADVYLKFQYEVEKRGGEFRKTIYSFGEVEGEVWALCRWLRARKFVYDDAIKMVEEATECHANPRENDYYPNPRKALGCDASVYFDQYPQLYTGFAKNGAPVFISKPGVLNTSAIECLTTLEGIVNFHWYIMMRDFGDLLRKNKEKNPNFKRFECFCILDLDHLSPSQLTNSSLAIIKQQSFIDSLCFPETMAKMVIVNAPRFFSATWTIIKGWLDARTSGKIDVLSNREKGHQKLLELIDADQLPSDYGGTSTDTKEILRQNIVGGEKRIETEMMYLRTTGSHTFEIHEGEYLDIHIHTRSIVGATFVLVDGAEKKDGETLIDTTEIKHTGGDEKELPTEVKFTKERIAGPYKAKIRGTSLGSRIFSQSFLIVGRVFPSK